MCDVRCMGELLHFLWPLYQIFWRIEELYFKVALISPLQHTGFQYVHILSHLCHCHCGRQKRLHIEFSSTICSKEIPFHRIVLALLLKINWRQIWSFFFASWTFYSTYLYFCFLKSIPLFDYYSSIVNFEVWKCNSFQLHSFSSLFFTFLCPLYFSMNVRIFC